MNRNKETFHLFPQFRHDTNVVIGSSELLVCIWKYLHRLFLQLLHWNMSVSAWVSVAVMESFIASFFAFSTESFLSAEAICCTEGLGGGSLGWRGISYGTCVDSFENSLQDNSPCIKLLRNPGLFLSLRLNLMDWILLL